MIRAAFFRLRDLGIIQPNPKPESISAPVVEKRESKRTKPTGPEMEDGWDSSGNPLRLTKKQVDYLSATEYRIFKRLDRDALEGSLPNIGPGPRGRQ